MAFKILSLAGYGDDPISMQDSEMLGAALVVFIFVNYDDKLYIMYMAM